jgi:hypothetical protein
MTDPIIRYNFDAVNAFINREEARSIEILRDARASRALILGQVAIRFGNALASLVFSIGIVAWLFHIDMEDGIRIYQFGADEEDIASIDGVLQGIRGDLDALQSDQSRREQEVLRRFSSLESEERSTDTVNVTFTIFEEVDLGDSGRVITGRRYLPSDIQNPNSEYCYHTSISASPSRMMTDLADRRGGKTEWAHEAPDSLLVLGKEHCRFLRK